MSNMVEIITAAEFVWLAGIGSLIALFRPTTPAAVVVESIFGAPNPDTLNVRIVAVSA